jgi:hypothetical protein
MSKFSTNNLSHKIENIYYWALQKKCIDPSLAHEKRGKKKQLL